jgi:hypothetical protein
VSGLPLPDGLTGAQVRDLAARLEREVATADGMKAIHAVYAAEANAYRRVIETLRHL